MDEHLETSWCPGCDRLIEPQRITVELDAHGNIINPSNPLLAAPAAAAPTAVGSPLATRRQQPQAGRAPGLVRGTGRVKPNGALRTADDHTRPRSNNDIPPVPPPSPVLYRPTSMPAQRRTRTFISQSQTPLYCSEQCRVKDAEQSEARRRGSSSSSAANRRTSHSSNSTGSSSLFDRPATRGASATSLEASPPKKLSPTEQFNAAIDWRKSQPKPAYGERPETMPPGWRPHDLEWRKVMYGDFDRKGRPARSNHVRSPSPASSAATTATAPALLEDEDDNAALIRQFFDQNMPFRRLSARTSSSTSVQSLASHRSRRSDKAKPSSPVLTPALTATTDDDDDAASEFEFEEDYINARMPAREARDTIDKLYKLKQESQRDALAAQYARECDAHRPGAVAAQQAYRARVLKGEVVPQTVQEYVMVWGPIQGRRRFQNRSLSDLEPPAQPSQMFIFGGRARSAQNVSSS